MSPNKYPPLIRIASLLLLAVMLAACGGWHLRGTQGSTDKQAALNNRIFVKSTSARYVGPALRKELSDRGAELASGRSEADLVVEVIGQRYDRRILSVDPERGKVREIEVALFTEFLVRAATGELLIPRETIFWQLDYTFDEGSVLGTTEQDSVVRRDLAKFAATAIALRVAALKLPQSTATGEDVVEQSSGAGQ